MKNDEVDGVDYEWMEQFYVKEKCLVDDNKMHVFSRRNLDKMEPSHDVCLIVIKEGKKGEWLGNSWQLL